MICPDTDFDCDNPGCRRGGCQGRRPALPLWRTQPTNAATRLPLREAEPETPSRRPDRAAA